MVGTIQGSALSSLITCLALIPAQREFVNTVKFKYPTQNVVGADAIIDANEVSEELLDLLPDEVTITSVWSPPACEGPEQSPISHVFCALRAYINDQTLRCPEPLMRPCTELLQRLMRPLGVEFHEDAEIWDSVQHPEGGMVVIGIPLWHGGRRITADDEEPAILLGVGPSNFIKENCLVNIESNYVTALDKLREVLQHAPAGRDVGTSVERTLRLCVVSKHTHIARVFPPPLVKDVLKKCDDATVLFAMHDLYGWSEDRFWNAKHRELVAKNLQLPLVHAGGAGLTPYHKVCHAAYAASWFQPAETISATHSVSDEC